MSNVALNLYAANQAAGNAIAARNNCDETGFNIWTEELYRRIDMLPAGYALPLHYADRAGDGLERIEARSMQMYLDWQRGRAKRLLPTVLRSLLWLAACSTVLIVTHFA